MITTFPTAAISLRSNHGPSAAVTVDHATAQGSAYLRRKTVQTNRSR
jgi:hypothetical protein